MFRIGKRISIVPLIILAWLLAGATTTQANMRFYSIVQRFCSNYNVTVNRDQMTLEKLDSGQSAFQLVLQSRLNNLEQTLAIGYIAAGQAIAQTGVGVEIIRITVVIPDSKHRQVLTEADASVVDQMRLGKLTPSEFIRNLELN